MGFYQLKQDANGIVLVFNAAGYQVIKLEGGFAEKIIITYLNMNQHEYRADDYMAGVIDGIMHCHMLKPDAFQTLPEVPPIPPSL